MSLKEQAAEVLKIIDRGKYLADGAEICIADEIKASVSGSPHHFAFKKPPWISGFSAFFGVKKAFISSSVSMSV